MELQVLKFNNFILSFLQITVNQNVKSVFLEIIIFAYPLDILLQLIFCTALCNFIIIAPLPIKHQNKCLINKTMGRNTFWNFIIISVHFTAISRSKRYKRKVSIRNVRLKHFVISLENSEHYFSLDFKFQCPHVAKKMIRCNTFKVHKNK